MKKTELFKVDEWKILKLIWYMSLSENDKVWEWQDVATLIHTACLNLACIIDADLWREYQII